MIGAKYAGEVLKSRDVDVWMRCMRNREGAVSLDLYL